MVVLHFNTGAAASAANQAKELQVLSSRVKRCINKARLEAQTIGEQLAAQRLSFSGLLKQADYPTYVYRDKRLIFWSDHTAIPDLELATLGHKPATVTNEYGAFVVVPHQQEAYNIYVCIPLQVDYRIKNHYLNAQLKPEIFAGIKAKLELEPGQNLPQIRSPEGAFLFSVDFKHAGNQAKVATAELLLLVLGTFFYVLFSLSLARGLMRKGRLVQGIALLLGMLFTFRLLLLVLNLPFALAEVELFDPRIYAASLWSPSVGDLALNVLLFLTGAGAAVYLFRKKKGAVLLGTMAQRQRRRWMAGCMLAFYLLLVLLFHFYYGIYQHSPLVLDVTKTLDFTRYKVIIFVIMFLHTLGVALLAYLLVSVVSVCVRQEARALWSYRLLLLLSAVLLALVGVFAAQWTGLLLLGLCFWLCIVVASRSKEAASLPYRTYLFLFLVLIISALTGALAMYARYQSELKAYKQKFAFNLMQENDVLAEYLLEEVASKVATDPFIRMKMKGPYVDVFFIKRKINRQYLSGYFDKYEAGVLLFDSEGRTLESADTAAQTLQELRNKYDKPETRTERPNLYLLRGPGPYKARTYLQLMEVPLGDLQRGTIVLQLTLKRLLPNSLVPELLVDQQETQTFSADKLSYAIYEDGALRYSEGEYDYATHFNRELMKRSELFRQGMSQDNDHHLAVRDEGNKVLVITTARYGGREVLSNFSFLFLFYTGSLLLCGLIYLVLQRHRLRPFRPNFSTKIQLFLNFGILLPLLLVSIATAGLVTASYKKDLMRTYEQRGEAVKEHLGRLLTDGRLQRRGELQSKVAEIAAISGADLNLYDRHGRLLVTSQPLIFEAGLLAKLVNPNAFAAISERQALRVLLEEQAGNLRFNAVYLPLRGEKNAGELLGFIGIPFFGSEKQLDLKLIELITTTMNIFTVMFILFMLLTFFAARALTVPLRLLADKLKRTSLTGKNEMLAYEGADEIGMLVGEYNRMLLTLEQNKQELAMQEKEAAWREMARQVAHEIKNPLTPMKLSLQYLQKAIAENKPNTEQLINKISHTLITQVNILNDIATSFSSFTAMPELKTELVDVRAALHKAADLHNDPAAANIQTDIAEAEALVLADEALMVRTFNNLLLNAMQAVPAGRKPQICVRLRLRPDRTVLITIRDNGNGIPKEIRHKVFVPNFSTKYTGSGIGLAVARKGIENAGGRIWFETQEGEGTTFFISLPLARS